MNTRRFLWIMGFLVWASTLQAATLGTAFTYQGKLTGAANTPVQGLYDLTFALYDAPAGGTQIGSSVQTLSTPVTNGLFMSTLDFGSVFNGNALYLQIWVKTNGAADWVQLNPRQLLTAAPNAEYAIKANVANVANGVAPNSIGAVNLMDNSIPGIKIADSTIGGVDLASDPAALSKVTGGKMDISGTGVNIWGDQLLWDHDIYLRGDTYHGLGWYGNPKVFGNYGPNGPVLYGFEGGALGYKLPDVGTNVVFSWNKYNQVGVDPLGVNTGSVTHASIVFGAGATGEGIASKRVGSGEINGLEFYTSFKPRISILNDGKVGIGTTTPSTVMEVFGTNFITGGTDGIVNVGNAAGYHLSLDDNEVHARYGNGVNTLFLNDFGGEVWIASRALKVVPGSGVFVNGTAAATSFSGSGAGLTGIPTTALLNGAVTYDKLAVNSVDGSKIADGSVGTAELANGAVTLAKLAPDSVDATKIVNGAVGTPEIVDGAVTSLKIADGAVQAVDLAPDAASLPKLSGNRIFINSGAVGIGTATPTDSLLDIEGTTHINDYDIFLRAGSDRAHGLGWYGAAGTPAKLFAGYNVDGPVLYGCAGGGLGTACGAQTLSLTWDQSGKVAVDPTGLNNGTLTPGLTFGLGSGEGIASKRTAGGNQFGLDFYQNYAVKMNLSSAGNFGIGNGTTPAPRRLTVVDGDNFGGSIQVGAQSTTLASRRIFFGDNEYVTIGENNYDDRLELRAASFIFSASRLSGSVGVGRAATANRLEVEGDASKTTAGLWLANSDGRIKKDVQPITGALQKLAQVRLVNFRYTDEYRAEHPMIEDRTYENVIAQEFQKVFPDAVKSSGEELADGSEILQVDTYPLVIYSAAAVQELNDKLEAKDAEIKDLKKRLEAIERLLKH